MKESTDEKEMPGLFRWKCPYCDYEGTAFLGDKHPSYYHYNSAIGCKNREDCA